MPVLTAPTVAVWGSFQEGMDEFAREGRGGEHDESTIGAELRDLATSWDTEEGFAAYVAALWADALEETSRRPGWVPCTTWWWIDGETWLGRIAVRHRLTPALVTAGGHIGYDIRPSARGRGHATAMLRATLPHAAALGIEDAWLTCDVDNAAFRRVIEANGGRLVGEEAGKLRFWVPTA